MRFTLILPDQSPGLSFESLQAARFGQFHLRSDFDVVDDVADETFYRLFVPGRPIDPLKPPLPDAQSFPRPLGRDYQLVFIGKFRDLANEIFNRRGENVDPAEMKHVIGPTENTAIHP